MPSRADVEVPGLCCVLIPPPNQDLSHAIHSGAGYGDLHLKRMLLWRGAAAFRACIPRFSGQFSSRTPLSRALGANQQQLPAPQRCSALPRLVFCQARRKAAAPDVPAQKVYKLPVPPHGRIHEVDGVSNFHTVHCCTAKDGGRGLLCRLPTGQSETTRKRRQGRRHLHRVRQPLAAVRSVLCASHTPWEGDQAPRS